MRCLAVLYCYPPLLLPAAVCYAKLVEGLLANDVKVELVTIAPESFVSPGGPVMRDAALAALVEGHAPQHVIRSPEASLPVKLAKWLDPGRRVTYRWLEPRKREWIQSALRHLLKLDLGRFDLLFTCSQPHANHLLGLELKRRTGMPWIAYYSDPWTDGVYVNFTSRRVHDYNRQLEDEVLRSADLVLFTCEEMRDLILHNHPVLDRARTGVLPHAFVPAWYAAAPRTEMANASGMVRILQTGGFYGPRTVAPLIEALQRVDQHQPLKGRLRIDSYGGVHERHRNQITRLGLGDVLVVHEYVPYLTTLSMMKAYDALLLIDAPATTTAQSVFLPSKLVDYLGAGTPIVAVTPGQGATARVVRAVGGVVCPLERPDDLDLALLRLLHEGASGQRPNREEAAHYDYRAVGRELLAMMEDAQRKVG